MKKIFRLTAMAAMVSMMATTATFTSCSDDDDDDDNTPTPVVVDDEDNYNHETFQVTVGGSKAEAGSFISVADRKVYNTAQVKELGENCNVEIIFDGSKFASASESKNDAVIACGQGAIIKQVEKGKKWSFTTSEGARGYIEVIEGTVGSETAQVKITVAIRTTKKDA